ncbi:NUDIX domain-containing protein [Corticibacterium sp. UT-5YL-CI-8]|nr:NUDIX domain-containing protein [Tianweitania sp. UT-5YL-CI-8]
MTAFTATDEYGSFMPNPTYEAKYGRGPHVSVDAFVEWRGQILLIRRQDGTWALPGGFVDPGEQLLDAAIRELTEETTINMSPADLRIAYRDPTVVFSDPTRDPRSHIITHVHRFELPAKIEVEVRAADDAKEAAWFTDVGPLEFYADHRQIVSAMESGASAAS